MTAIKKHFVEFLSPGTFVSEVSQKPIDAWDVYAAVAMAKDISERHGARPYGFRFLTRGRGDNDLDSTVLDQSGIYYLGGTVRTADEVLSGSDPKEEVLRSNVRINGIKRIIVNNNSWRVTAALHECDTVLDVKLPPRGA